MTTAQDVFNQAIRMMDEQSEANGNTHIADTKEYKYRTLDILNSIIPSLYPYSDTYPDDEDGRPVSPAFATYDINQDPDLTQVVPLDDVLARGVLPYALAEHLLAPEDPDLSAWFGRKYAAAFIDLRDKIPRCFEPVEPPFGLF